LVRRYSLILLAVLFLFGCGSAPASPTIVPATEIPSPAPTNTPLPDYQVLIRNASYQLGATDALKVVQLKDGMFEQGQVGDADYFSVKLTDYVAAGDLNNDGVDEVAAVIAENYGGSGVFTFLAVYAELNGSLEFVTSIFVDDRPRLNVLSIEVRGIFLDAVTHNAEDPFCCPTLHSTRHYRLDVNKQLDLSDLTTFTPDEKPHTITIDAPQADTKVSGAFQIKGSVAIAPFENNLVYRIYDTGGVELAAGSVTVSASELGGPGTFDSTVRLGNVLSGAVIRIEIQDRSAKDDSLIAMNSVELVVK